MSVEPLPGLGVPLTRRDRAPALELIEVQRPLRRVLAFLGRSIDDVIDNPIARNEVYGYYKLSKQVQRTCEIVDLERWWNPNGLP
jgi:hypothetical protein